MKIRLTFDVKTRRKKLWKRLRTVSKQSKHNIYELKTALKVWPTDLGRVGRLTVDQSSALKEG